jgi:hypothetical protein
MDMTAPWWRLVDRTPDCWLWSGFIDQAGYGRYGGGPEIFVHRLAYLELVGPIDPNLELDHLCRVRNCVNPAHLEQVTQAENMRRQLRTYKVFCPQGHPKANAPNGRRYCPTCTREATRSWLDQDDNRATQNAKRQARR